MKPVSVFFEIDSQYAHNPIKGAMTIIVTKLTAATITEKLLDNQNEADIAVVNEVKAALRIMKETEKTIVLIAHLGKNERMEAEALASRFPERMKAAPYVESDGEQSVITILIAMIGEKAVA